MSVLADFYIMPIDTLITKGDLGILSTVCLSSVLHFLFFRPKECVIIGGTELEEVELNHLDGMFLFIYSHAVSPRPALVAHRVMCFVQGTRAVNPSGLGTAQPTICNWYTFLRRYEYSFLSSDLSYRDFHRISTENCKITPSGIL